MTEHTSVLYFTNGTVWLGPDRESAADLLVVDGTVVGSGETAASAALDLESTGAHIDRIDLDGAFLMGAFGDGHAHPLFGGLEEFGPRVRGCSSIAEIVAEVRRYALANPDQDWILGASYDGSLAPNGLFDAHWLDEAVNDRPVVLRAWDYHTVWCNSKALELAGITASTPEPPLGEIPRREDGSPLGTLREWGAVDLVDAVCPPRSLDERVEALARATTHYAALGVTWVQDAWVEPRDIEVYLEAARRGVLATRLNLAILADPRVFPGSLADMVAARNLVTALDDPFLTATTVKFFADGVVENETGALLEPYCSGMHDHGMAVWDRETLSAATAAVDAAGFQIHIHAIGDAAVRNALDAIEHTATVNGDRDRRPVIAHAQLVSDDDMLRFAELGVIVNAQPLWAQLDALMTVLTVPRLGQERSDKQYALKSIARSGATLSFGSDWPVSSGAPLDGIEIAVTRTTPEGEPAGGWTPHERLSIETALDSYSRAVAFQAFGTWGSTEPGSAADLVILAADPRSTDPASLSSIPVVATYRAGTPTYRAPREQPVAHS